MTGYTGSSIDHLNITVTDLDTSRAFYDAVLSAIGIETLLQIPAGEDHPAMVGYGRHPKPFFWIASGRASSSPELHVAFTVPTREHVHAFHSAALEHGAVIRIPPGIRPEYHDDYFGAFVSDPDGNNIEAVCHARRRDACRDRRAASA